MKRLPLLAALLCATFLLAPRTAHAGAFIGVDVNAAKLVGDGSEAFDVGYGGNLRFGWEVPIPVLTLQLGGLFRYDQWNATGGGGSVKATDIMVGGRAGLGVLLKPWVGAYIGYGHLSFDAGGVSSGEGGTALLIGGGLDIALPVIAVGVHLDWNKDVIDVPGGQSATGWLGAGANLTISF